MQQLATSLQRGKRILWLLNHKTLMPYEADLLQRLGFEVFVPKVFPQIEDYRSCVVDDEYDARITIPRSCLKRLNAFNFYEGRWPGDIVALANRYFGAAVVVALGQQLPEVVDRFEGQIIFRAFGLDGSHTYKALLQMMYGDALLSKIYRLGARFWFGEGYKQLSGIEPRLLSDRALFLPVGAPPSVWRNANTWNGSADKILFVCRNVVTNPYYRAIYQAFKRDFGDLPHVIVGSQDVAVDDPHVLGYVSDDELRQLYRDCRLLYYHSREPRHVHYSPVEALIVGTPVVFFNQSLLGRLSLGQARGGIDSPAQARATVERLLSGDREFSDRLRSDQGRIAHQFSDAYCRPAWEQSLTRNALLPLREEPLAGVLSREVARSALIPLTRFSKRRARSLPLPPVASLQEPLSDGEERGSLANGIDFRQAKYPNFVCHVSGMANSEPWGRWSSGPKISVLLSHSLEHRFRLVIKGGGYGKNIGAPVKIRIGDAARTVRFSKPESESETIAVDFAVRKPSNLIEIDVPHPTVPEGDRRAVGIGLIHMRLEIPTEH